MFSGVGESSAAWMPTFSNTWIGAKSRALLLSALTLAAMSIVTADAEAVKKASVRVVVPALSQKSLAKSPRVSVSVKSSAAVTVTVKSLVASSDAASSQTLRFTKPATKSVTLTLSAAGRTKLLGCGKQTLVVSVEGAARVATASRAVTASARDCKPPRISCDPATGDPLDQHRCLLPWPNNFYTRSDSSTPTGRRLAFALDQMPRSRKGEPIAPAPYLRSDGFSGNSALLAYFAGVDTNAALKNSNAATIDRIGRSIEADAPIQVIDALSGERQPIWSEVDMSTKVPSQRMLITHGAKTFKEGRRYIVVMRSLKRSNGSAVAASGWFKQIRDRKLAANAPAEVKARAKSIEPVLGRLAQLGIERSSLLLAWDFTTASRQSLSGPALKMRNEAFSELGDTNLADFVEQGSSPQASITLVENYSTAESHYVLRRVDGTIKVPCFMTSTDYAGKDVGPCGPGTTMNYDSAGLPVRARGVGNAPLFFDAPFTCVIPRESYDSSSMASDKVPMTFGHGLLGDATSLTGIKNRSGIDVAVVCGTDWIGMANKDIPTVLQALININKFPSIAERSTQSLINFLYLGRWMVSQAAGGLNDAPAFDPPGPAAAYRPFDPGGGKDLIDPDQKLFNLGGSQGGIMGGALTALSPDFERSVLDVPAIGYSTLMSRSQAGSIFVPTFQGGYPDPEEGQIILSLVQTIWDRGEGGGYVHHVTDDPLPNTPAHKILIIEAFGDHLVTNIQTETEARTVGAVMRTPALDPGRSLDEVPFWGIPTEPATSFAGPIGFDAPAVLIPIDIGPKRQEAGGVWRGVDPNLQSNNWPTAGYAAGQQGVDPHGDVAGSPLALMLLRDFVRSSGGVVTDQAFDSLVGVSGCGLLPCYAEGWAGPGAG